MQVLADSRGFDTLRDLAKNVLSYYEEGPWCTEIILCMGPANERRRYRVTSSFITLAHPQKDPWCESRIDLLGLMDDTSEPSYRDLPQPLTTPAPPEQYPGNVIQI